MTVKVLSADSLCKQIGPRSHFVRPDLDPICMTLKEFFENVDFLKNQQTSKKHENFLRGQRVLVCSCDMFVHLGGKQGLGVYVEHLQADLS